MPKNKRPNRRAGGKKKPGKPTGAGKPVNAQAPAGGKAEISPGRPAVAKTYGTPKSARSSFTPAISRRSARNR